MKSNISMNYHHHHHSKAARTTTTTTEESAISPGLLTFLAVTFLFNTYNLRSRPWDIAFVVVTYSNLLLLFWCIEAHHKTPEGSRKRKGLRAGVCILSNTLILTISYQVAGMMPLAVKLLVWAMAGATVSGLAYGFFVYCPKPEDNEPATVSGIAYGFYVYCRKPEDNDDDELEAGTRAAAALEP